jgi:guanylate kinase
MRAITVHTGKYKIDTLYVHVVPPDMDVLQARMEGRLKEHGITINKRIAFAQSEVSPFFPLLAFSNGQQFV